MSIEGDKGGTRIARGEDGVNYKVPDDMKYDEWKENTLTKIMIQGIIILKVIR